MSLTLAEQDVTSGVSIAWDMCLFWPGLRNSLSLFIKIAAVPFHHAGQLFTNTDLLLPLYSIAMNAIIHQMDDSLIIAAKS